MAAEVGAMGVVKGTPVGATDRRSRHGNDCGILHLVLVLSDVILM
jgi:hypothetical protein